VTRLSTKQLAEATGELLKEYLDPVNAHLTALDTRLAALDVRFGQLEKSDGAKCYRGVFDTAETYVKHNCVTHGGSLWIAMCDSPGWPGAADNNWKLAVKRGKDGKDAHP
jgi:hypothetical protein